MLARGQNPKHEAVCILDGEAQPHLPPNSTSLLPWPQGFSHSEVSPVRGLGPHQCDVGYVLDKRDGLLGLELATSFLCRQQGAWDAG